MTYEAFKIMIKNRMQEIMGDSIEVRFEKYHKNNLTEIESLTFKEKKPLFNEVLSPAINMKDLYTLYKQSNESLNECLQLIQKLYEKQEPKSFERLSGKWSEIKRQVSMALIHKAWNEEWLDEGQVPYKDFLDFAIILRRTLETSPKGIATMVITRDLINLWDITEEELWETARINLKHEKFYIQNLNEVIGQEIQETVPDISALDLEGTPPLYIMSNKDRSYGSRAILRTDLLQAFASETDCNLFILPSSIHEVLLLPDHGEIDVEKLRANVKETNSACLEEYDKLSDNVYYFKKGSDNVEPAR